MPNFQEQLDQVPFDSLGGHQEIYKSYSDMVDYLDFEGVNTSYGLRQSITVGEDFSADSIDVNRGVAVLWYTDNLLYAEDRMGGSVPSGFSSGPDFFLRNENIEFVLDQDFTEDDASSLEKALEY